MNLLKNSKNSKNDPKNPKMPKNGRTGLKTPVFTRFGGDSKPSKNP
jgi:hypothetical protein